MPRAYVPDTGEVVWLEFAPWRAMNRQATDLRKLFARQVKLLGRKIGCATMEYIICANVLAHLKAKMKALLQVL